MTEKILIGVANDKPISIEIDELSKWTPKNVSYFSDMVYFKNEDKFYMIKQIDFNRIFKK